MIHQPDPQEIVCRHLLAQSISEEPLESGFYHDYKEEGEEVIDLEVEGSYIDQPPPTPVSVADTNQSEAAIGDSLLDQTASPERFQPEETLVSTIGAKVYDSICKFCLHRKLADCERVKQIDFFINFALSFFSHTHFCLL